VGASNTKHLLAYGVRRDWSVIAIILLFTLAVLFTSRLMGSPSISAMAVMTNFILIALGLIISAGLYVIGMLAIERPVSPFAFLRTDARILNKVRNFPVALPILIALAIFMPAFSTAKDAVGTIMPYAWDDTFTHWDIAIHGTDAWALMHPITGYPLITFLIAICYQCWILLLYIATPLMAVGAFGSPKVRYRFLLASTLCWIIIGSVLANMLASVGPCFLKAYTGSAHFDPLMLYLQTANQGYPLMVLDVQKTLLDWQQSGGSQLGRGISAMPSMHVSLAFLFFLMMRHVSPLAGRLFGIYFVIILIGSVHLGYHYAVDGYVSIIITGLIWKATGYLAKGVSEDLSDSELS
jgi:hypothetical protein